MLHPIYLFMQRCCGIFVKNPFAVSRTLEQGWKDHLLPERQEH